MNPKRPAPWAAMSSGRVSPLSAPISAATRRTKAADRPASNVAGRTGLPISRISAATIASFSASISSAALVSHAARVAAGVLRCARKAASAFSTAASTRTASESTIRDAILPSTGEISS